MSGTSRHGSGEKKKICRRDNASGQRAAAHRGLDLLGVLIHLGQLQLAAVRMRALEHRLRQLVIRGGILVAAIGTEDIHGRGRWCSSALPVRAHETRVRRVSADVWRRVGARVADVPRKPWRLLR